MPQTVAFMVNVANNRAVGDRCMEGNVNIGVVTDVLEGIIYICAAKWVDYFAIASLRINKINAVCMLINNVIALEPDIKGP